MSDSFDINMSTIKLCKGLTKIQTPCKNKVKNNKYCHIHNKNDIHEKIKESEGFITITFCECSENHVGMEQNGVKVSKGFTLKELKEAQKIANDKKLKTDLYKLHSLIESPIKEEYACVLVIRDAIDNLDLEETQKTIFNQLADLKWDDKYYDVRRSKVLNKHARTNICIGDTTQIADFENKKGTIYNFKDIPSLNKIRKLLPDFLGKKAKGMLAEGNYYLDRNKNGIGYHGDSERRLVVGVRFGKTEKSSSLHYRWYKNNEIISKTLEVPLNNGDIYIMSHKAVGTDWRLKIDHKTKEPLRTLRHASGALKYVK